MAVYILSIMNRSNHKVITIPKTWRVKNVGPDDRYVFAVELANGNLEIFCERSYYEQKFSKLKSPRDSGTGQAVPGQDTPAGNSGDGEQSSEMRSASTDISEKGVELIQD